MNYSSELSVNDVDTCISRSESYGMNTIPAYLREAAAKAGKVYNNITHKFEPITSNN